MYVFDVSADHNMSAAATALFYFRGGGADLIGSMNELLEWNKVTIQLLQVSGGKLTVWRKLSDIRDKNVVGAWTLTNDLLLYWDILSKDLIVYTFAWAIRKRPAFKNQTLINDTIFTNVLYECFLLKTSS